MNFTGAILSDLAYDMDSPFLSEVWSSVVTLRNEFILFFAAVAAYILLFGDARRKPKNRAPKEGSFPSFPLSKAEPAEQTWGRNSPRTSTNMEKAFEDAYERGDHRQALRCWAAMKKSTATPVSLTHAVESMQRMKKDLPFISREVRTFLTRCSASAKQSANSLLDFLTRRLESELVEKVLEIMASLDLRPDERACEVLLNMYFTLRNFVEVQRLVREMEERQVAFTNRARVAVMKTALKMGSFEEARRHFAHWKAKWPGATAVGTPRFLVSQMVEMACRERRLGEIVPVLQGVPLTEEVVHTMLSECVRQKNATLASEVEKLAREQELQFSDETYSLMVRSMLDDPTRVHQLFDEVVSKNTPMTADFALAVLTFCSQTRSVALANRLYEHLRPQQLPVVSAFIRFYADAEQFEKACDVYEQSADAVWKCNNVPSCFDARTERCLMTAALQSGRQQLARAFLDAAPADVAKHIAMIRNCASSGHLQGVMNVFDSLRRSSAELNSVVYNSVLDGCVECRDLQAAELWMKQTKKAGFVDVVSYNTLIKAYLQEDMFDKARALVEEMKAAGISPNRITFNELVNGLVAKGVPAHRGQIWGILHEMKAAGVKPNQVTCSILLKMLSARSSPSEIKETMDLLTVLDEPMDEVLMSSVVEACVRIGKPDLLMAKLKQFAGDGRIGVSGSHTFGSLIKAYGRTKDIDGVWRCWNEMRSRHIRPTSITLGCMVEAVVSNGDSEGAYALIHQMQRDEQCREALNSVIYCSVLKGFTREKNFERVWEVYEEMKIRQVDRSHVTYNTLIDACARCGLMDRVPQIVEEMRKNGIQPNLITYSTMLKGHCQAGHIKRAFATLQEMKRDTDLQPDEIMYNSLLDGCAQHSLVEEGLSLLDQMQKEGVAPSNFTLSLLVKLMNRARKLDRAFRLVDEICRQYNFHPNVHVYTNLIQACISNRQSLRAMRTFEEMLTERVQPDGRTYLLLVRSLMGQSRFEQAAGLIRAALGLPGAIPCVRGKEAVAMCPNIDPQLVAEALQTMTDKGQVQELAAPLLADIRKLKPQVRIDAKVHHAVMSAGMAQATSNKSKETWADIHPAQPRPHASGRTRCRA